MNFRPRHLAFLLALSLACSLLPAATFEPWIESAIARETPEWAGQASALILLDESSHEIDAQGIETVTQRYIARMLTTNGKEHAVRRVYYDSKSAKVKSLRAWLIRPGQKTQTLNNSEWIDACTEDALTLASDIRYRQASFADKAVAGDLFVVETKVVGPMFASYLRRNFGNTLPMLVERLQVSLPAGFTVEAQTWGETKPSVSHEANTWTWTVTNRPHRPEESYDTPAAHVDCDLMVRIDPPASSTTFKPLHLSSWSEITQKLNDLNNGKCDTSPELAAKARELAGSLEDPIAKIQAIGQFVQKLRYISNAEGLNQGQGMVARPASLVYSRRFGDCKDKANLMRAMLREVGITCLPVGAGSGLQEMIRPEAANMFQFNHAICAIEVAPTCPFPAVLRTEELGSLLLFDPTDPYTHLGDVPRSIQHTFIQVRDPRLNRLLPVPVIPPEIGHRIARRALLKIRDDGTLEIEAEFERNGQQAAAFRAGTRHADSNKDLDKIAMSELGDALRTGQLTKRSLLDNPEQGTATLKIEASVRSYLQRNQGALIIAKLDVFNRSQIPVYPEKNRRTTAELPPLCLDDVIRLQVPEGLVIEELPRPASVKDKYGSLTLSFEQKDSVVTLRRRLVLNRTLVPVNEFLVLRKFMADLARSDRSSVLLRLAAPAAAK